MNRLLLSKHQLIDCFVFIFCLCFSVWLMTTTLKSNSGQILFASKLWSDFAAHLPLVRSFSLGANFPPEYPTFPGEPIRYHYLFYLVSGLLEKAGFSFAAAVNLPSIVGFCLLLYLLYRVSILIFNSRIAGIFSLLLFLFNGTLTFVSYFNRQGLSLSSLLQIPSLTHFISFGPWDGKLISAFWNLNIYTNQRHLGLSFALTLLLLYPFLVVLSRRLLPKPYWYPLILVIAACLPFLHQTALIFALVVSFSIMVFDYRYLKSYLPLILCLILGSLTLITSPHPNTQAIAFSPGYLARDLSLFGLLQYWFWNLGFYLILMPLAFFFAPRAGKIIFPGFFFFFLIANLFRLSPDMINNHKLINFFMLCLILLSAGLLARLWHRGIIQRFVDVLMLFLLTFSGIIDFFPIVNDYYLYLDDYPRNPTAFWIQSNTPPQSVFLTNTYLYNPASLVGRKTYEDYGYFNWSIGYNDSARRATLPLFFASQGDLKQVCQALISHHLDYIYLASGPGDLTELNPQSSLIAQKMTPAYQSIQGDRIYDIRQNCQP